MTRKEKQRMKKAEKAEKQKLMKEARNLEDDLVDELFEQVWKKLSAKLETLCP